MTATICTIVLALVSLLSPVPLNGAPEVLGGTHSARGEVRESAVGWHPYPDPVPSGAPLSGTSSIAIGKASWCAPTPRYCHGWGGRSLLAAVPGYDHVPYWAKVCRQDQPKTCVTVHVVSVCACGTGKVIDLTVYAFRDRLGVPLSRGTVEVEVTPSESIPLPPTDCLGEC